MQSFRTGTDSPCLLLFPDPPEGADGVGEALKLEAPVNRRKTAGSGGP